eukprot:TRINITY_DN8034_c0_g2_i8.p1 TRINITY_DN8034_c0_g2~~TRINITY_DN8034_c0_g2_i8.p1  ORF type:complete len:189 (+),score=38.56 TRINITY_DN8034_c0_g2_i8:149-715(+)
MKAENKKVEVLLKVNLVMEKVSKESVKQYLEQTIPGLEISSVNIQSAKPYTKAVVASNAFELLLGSNQAVYRQSRNASVIGGPSNSFSSSSNSEGKTKEIVELEQQLRKVRRELEEEKLKTKNPKEKKEERRPEFNPAKRSGQPRGAAHCPGHREGQPRGAEPRIEGGSGASEEGQSSQTGEGGAEGV